MKGRHPDDRGGGKGLTNTYRYRNELSANRSAVGGHHFQGGTVVGAHPENVGPLTGGIDIGQTSKSHKAAAKPRKGSR